MNIREYVATISRYKKERLLYQLTEDQFRDVVVRPLFLLRGMQDGRDLCGPNEAGKDSIFTAENQLGLLDVYALQTKRGHLNLGRKRNDNVVEAVTQLKTALATTVMLLRPKGRVIPNRAILCASGKIGPNARDYICEQVKDPNISFLDSDDLIPDIDDKMPQFWLQIDANLLPYVRALKRSIDKGTQMFTRGELVSADLSPVASSDDAFVPLRVHKLVIKRKTVKGHVEQIPHFEEIPVTSLIYEKETLILLVGGAGGGKSTAILRMVHMLCEKLETSEGKSPIPVIFRAQELTSPGETLLDAVFTRTNEIGGSKGAPISFKDLDAGQLHIFVDALDEVGDINVQKAILMRIISFSKTYPKCRVIVSSRSYYSIQELPELARFAEYNLSTLSYKDAQKILVRLHKAESMPIHQATEFLRRLQDVHGLELNPLIVTVFAASNDTSRSDIPANITELFKKFTELMLGRWDASKGIAAQYHAPLKDFILTRLAFRLHSRKETSLKLIEFRDIVREELSSRGYKADFEMFADEILNRSGLFRVVNETVEFRHLMLQEFFAGRGIPSSANVIALVPDDWWRRALVFYFGERPNEGDLLRQVSENLPMDNREGVLSATITLGLALQASYLLETIHKIPLIAFIFRSIAEAFSGCEEKSNKSTRFPLGRFVDSILYAREGVAFSALKEERENIRTQILEEKGVSAKITEARQFWLIVGLIESGDLEGATAELSKFDPKDRRYYLGLHLGAFLILHRRVTTIEERRMAGKICDNITHKIQDLRQEITKEFHSELLEIQKGRMTALEKEIRDETVPKA